MAGLSEGVLRRKARQEEGMREYRDPHGRPIRRLYLSTDVLDRRCEGLMREFMNRRSGGYWLPVPTNELMRLLDERAGEIDPYADLPKGLAGKTTLYFDRRPQVEIAQAFTRLAVTIEFDRLYVTSSDTSGYTVHCGVKPAREKPQA